MKFFSVEPEIAGWGENTVYSRLVGKRVVHKLHCEFDQWLGDQMVESRACFIVTTRLARDIERARLTGASFDAVEVTTSDMFHELYPNRPLPRFVWLKVTGRAKRHDFGVAPNLLLVVSERAHDVLKRVGVMDAATFTPLEG
jgi:hypothetical protein